MVDQQQGRLSTTSEKLIKRVVENLEGVATGFTKGFKAKGKPLRHAGVHLDRGQFYVAARWGAVFWRNEFHLATAA